MNDYIFNVILWILALYGLFEIIKKIIFSVNSFNTKADGIYLIVAVKNQENKIEGFIRSILFRFFYGQKVNLIITDLGSKDETTEILDKLKCDYNFITVNDWSECKELLDKV